MTMKRTNVKMVLLLFSILLSSFVVQTSLATNKMFGELTPDDDNGEMISLNLKTFL
jgi:hypothetical protein